MADKEADKPNKPNEGEEIDDKGTPDKPKEEGKKEKKKEGKEKKAKAKGGKGSFKSKFFLFMVGVAAIVFLPTTMLLVVGMLPAIVALFFGSRGIGARASTVSAMNLAGCIPYVFKLWSSGNDFEASIGILSSNQALLIMYLGAAFGYLIDWVVSGLVSSFLYQKGVARMKTIRKRQKVLVKQWGAEVAGDIDISWMEKKK